MKDTKRKVSPIDILVRVIWFCLITVTVACSYAVVTRDYPSFQASFLDGWKPETSQHDYC